MSKFLNGTEIPESGSFTNLLTRRVPIISLDTNVPLLPLMFPYYNRNAAAEEAADLAIEKLRLQGLIISDAKLTPSQEAVTLDTQGLATHFIRNTFRDALISGGLTGALGGGMYGILSPLVLGNKPSLRGVLGAAAATGGTGVTATIAKALVDASKTQGGWGIVEKELKDHTRGFLKDIGIIKNQNGGTLRLVPRYKTL